MKVNTIEEEKKKKRELENLRDYFAAIALQGLSQLARDDYSDRIASYCYEIADAMLRVRGNKNED